MGGREADIWIRQAEKRDPNISIQIAEPMDDSRRRRGFPGSATKWRSIQVTGRGKGF